MTIESTTTKEIYEGNGAATVFPVPFSYSRTDDLFLLFTNAAGEETPITGNYRIEVLESGATSAVYPLTGLPIPAGAKLTVYRSTPQKQIVDLIYGGAFNPEVLEKDGFDRTVLMIQEVGEKAERAIKVAMSSTQDSADLSADIFAAREQAVSAAALASASEADAEAAAAIAAQAALNAKADAERAAALVDPASLASSVYNVRKAFVAEADVPSGGVLTLPGYYYPTRDVLFLAYEGVVCTPRLAGVAVSALYQYEEVGSDPDVISNMVVTHFPVKAGDLFDMWVVSSAAGRNIAEIEALVAQAAGYCQEAATAQAAAAGQAGRAEQAALNLPDVNTAGDGQTLVARAVGGVMQARYENPPSPAATGSVTVLGAPLAAGVSYTVPAYIVGSNKLQMYVDGVRCERGASQSVGMYQEAGVTGGGSTSITFFENLPAGMQISAVSAG